MNSEEHEPNTQSREELPPLCTPAQVSEFIGVPLGTLAFWRFEGTHLKFVKLGRLVRYRREDVRRFLDENVFESTAAAAKAAR